MSPKRTASSSPSPVAAKRVKFGADDTTPSVPTLPVGPGGPMEIVFSFDTTGSMSSCLVQVRKNLSDMIKRLQKDIPGLRMAVFAHGDYCDARSYYVTKHVDFTNDVSKLVNFVNNTGATGGGDSDECYELVLYEARTELSWTPGTQRSLVMIGDANPHGVHYPDNKLKLDWEKETEKLHKDMGVHIYGVHCGGSSSEPFYQTLANTTDGRYIELKDWNNIFDMMMAICYREHGAEFYKAYEHEVRSRGPAITHEMDAMLKALRHPEASSGDDDSEAGAAAATTTTTVTPVAKIKKATPKKTGKKTVTTKKPVIGKKAPTTVEKRAKRESLGRHPFASLDWSRWQKLMTKSKPTNRLAKNWIPKRFKSIGYRRIGLFRDIMQSPALYELGVKVPDSRKIHATFFRVTSGLRSAGHIDAHICQHSHVLNQIDDVIKKGCDVYIRRAELPASVNIDGKDLTGCREVRDYVRRRFEYAWNKGVYGKLRHRSVIKKGIKISSDAF